jgi:hypothetical protein
VPEALAQSVAKSVARLRALELAKPPGVAEAIDWARALALLGADAAEDTLGWAVKNHEDLERARIELFSG